jgi:hypothetical protein
MNREQQDIKIDHSIFFMPEHLTHLYYLDCYQELSDEFKLRYNQLMALYMNEQTAFFEQFLTGFLSATATAFAGNDEIVSGVDEFISDELEHTRWFVELNQAAAPNLFANSTSCFVSAGAVSEVLFRQMMRRPRLFPLFIWVILFQEERGSYFSKEYLKQADTLEPSFVEVQRRHLEDEASHFDMDVVLVDILWRQASDSVRRFNARMLRYLFAEFLLVPKRSGIKVLEVLAKESQECRAALPRLKEGMLKLHESKAYHEAFFSRAVVPTTLSLFDEFEEMHQLHSILLSYEPRVSEPRPAARYKIPGTLNVVLACVQIVVMVSLFALIGAFQSWPVLLAAAVVYGIVMNSGYALIHEAEHNMFHEKSRINDGFGMVLALFFPAPFHLIRQGHIGHHMRNRSDDEAFDFYFEGENPVWKYLQLYGILTGFFWLVICITNILALFAPRVLKPKYGWFDRPTEALLESLNPRYFKLIQLEALAIFTLHGCLIY